MKKRKNQRKKHTKDPNDGIYRRWGLKQVVGCQNRRLGLEKH